MAEAFKHLFSPLKIGPVTVRNRMMSVGHAVLLADDGMPGERTARYQAEKAKGGIGLIDVDWGAVHRTSKLYPGNNCIWDDKYVPGWKLVADMVHEHGAKIVTQIGHVGRQMTSHVSELPVWSSSSVPCPANREMPKTMEIEDIEELVRAYGEAARRVRAAGFDGVTIHSSYGGYGLAQFISPYSNKRRDEYGGSLENRLRILMEVIDAVRENVSDGMIVGAELNGDDFSPGGLTLPDYQEIARRVEATGKIDYIIVKAGTYLSVNLGTAPDMQHSPGLFIPLAAAIKEVVDKVKIVAQARINDPVMADKVLADGQADMIGMTRQNLCDPETANKAREGRPEDIRHCIACNQGCVGNVYRSLPITCIQNPAAGKEKELGIGTLKRAERKKKVVVIGGGPGGMKAAEIAARRGHDVTLYEKRKELGGQVRIGAKATLREEFGEVTRWLEIQIKKLGVRINVGVEATADMVLRQTPDAIVVATGSRPTRTLIGLMSYGLDDIPGLDKDNVLDTWQVLEDGKEVGEKVLVVDDGEGTWKGVSVAETLADRGKTVEIISPLAYIGMTIPPNSLGPMFTRLWNKNIKLSPLTTLTGVSGNAVSVVSQGKPTTIEGVDTVVLAGWHKPDEDLYFALKGKSKELHRIGDCIASRTALEAIREGDRVGRLL